jgi:hypothetical protein
MDFFTVPTVTFNLLYCCFIISHDRRRILHFKVTRHPTSDWIVQQLREAFPYQSAPYQSADCFTIHRPVVVPAKSLLGQLL